jgi:hypothetical protein
VGVVGWAGCDNFCLAFHARRISRVALLVEVNLAGGGWVTVRFFGAPAFAPFIVLLRSLARRWSAASVPPVCETTMATLIAVPPRAPDTMNVDNMMDMTCM